MAPPNPAQDFFATRVAAQVDEFRTQFHLSPAEAERFALMIERTRAGPTVFQEGEDKNCVTRDVASLVTVEETPATSSNQIIFKGKPYTVSDVRKRDPDTEICLVESSDGKRYFYKKYKLPWHEPHARLQNLLMAVTRAHPKILTCYDSHLQGPGEGRAPSYEFLLECMDPQTSPDLKSAVLNGARFDEETVARAIIDICEGLFVLQRAGTNLAKKTRGYVHNDVKLDNLFGVKDGGYFNYFVLGDLDIVELLSPVTPRFREGLRGSVPYMPPEGLFLARNGRLLIDNVRRHPGDQGVRDLGQKVSKLHLGTFSDLPSVGSVGYALAKTCAQPGEISLPYGYTDEDIQESKTYALALIATSFTQDPEYLRLLSTMRPDRQGDLAYQTFADRVEREYINELYEALRNRTFTKWVRGDINWTGMPSRLQPILARTLQFNPKERGSLEETIKACCDAYHLRSEELGYGRRVK